MTTILADSFTAALSRLSNDEQKQVKLTAFDLQTDPNRPGLQFHRIDNSKDPNFWSVRVNRDLRIIIHKTGGSVMLAYVDHHDDAYAWAERRRIEAHPKTGVVQIVEVRERVEEPVRQFALSMQADLPFVLPNARKPEPLPLFAALSTDDVLSIGVPQDWVDDVRSTTEDGFFSLAKHLPQEAAEALLDYVSSGSLKKTTPISDDPYTHPDAQRRFRILEGHEELAAALDQPFEKWAVFLHPSQRALVDRQFTGPARVMGSAGTGKTVVALHRVARIVRADPAARILLTTFSEPLASSLKTKLKLLLADEPGLFDQVTISSFLGAATDLQTLRTGRKPFVIARDKLRAIIAEAAVVTGITRYSPQFLNSEWNHVIDAWQIDGADAYALVPRMGRKNRLGAKQREELWTLFAAVRQELRRKGFLTPASLYADVAEYQLDRPDKPYSHIVVDEAQDLGVAELRFLLSIGPGGNNGLFFAGDIGQRIFQQPFSWKGLGVDMRGRSFTLKVNYRTSHQIRRMADLLLPNNIRDADGETDERRGTISVFEGIEPTIVIAPDEEGEAQAAAVWLKALLDEGINIAEIGIFCRSNDQIARAARVAELAGVPTVSTLEGFGVKEGLLIGTMHLSKGLEFRAVLIVACDENVLPLASRIADVSDEFELDEVVSTERQLLYVAATRARDHLFISGIEPGSEFIDEFR